MKNQIVFRETNNKRNKQNNEKTKSFLAPCLKEVAMRCDAMRCDAMRCDAMRCDVMRCDAL